MLRMDNAITWHLRIVKGVGEYLCEGKQRHLIYVFTVYISDKENKSTTSRNTLNIEIL